MRVDQMDGFFVGMLDADELAALNAAIERGEARRSYEGSSGFMGLAKVRLTLDGTLDGTGQAVHNG